MSALPARRDRTEALRRQLGDFAWRRDGRTADRCGQLPVSDPKPPAATVTYREVNKCERSHFRALALDIDRRQSRRSRLSRCLTAPELYEDLRVDPIVELAGHQIG